MKPTPQMPSRGMRIQNDNAAVIPPRSIVVVTSVATSAATSTQEAETITHVDKYNGTRAGNIMVTGVSPIKPGGQGMAFYDSFLFVAIDQSITAPKAGEQWGPVPNQWYVSRGGMGFFAQGHPASNGDPAKSMFRRDRGWAWCKLASTLSFGSTSSPTTCTVNIWHRDPSSGATPAPLVVASNTGLLGLTIANYDSSLSGPVGAMAKIERGADGLSFYWVGCP